MKILLPAAEVAPIIKFGGLGDVIGSLPKALDRIGIDVDVIVPYYNVAKVQKLKVFKSLVLNVPFNNENNVVEIFKTKLPGSNVDVVLVKNQKYFSSYGDKKAEKNKETEIFSFFCKSVVEYIKSKYNTYDLIHCNDWHTGLITHLLVDEMGYTRPATLFTVHNIMYQGVSDYDIIHKIGIIPGSHPLVDWDISDGDLNMIQQGVTSSDYVNAVSPSYAKEILSEEYGGFLAEILKAREGRLTGILNGVDYSAFPRKYNEKNWKKIKPGLKKELQSDLGLSIEKDKPVFSFIGRLDPNQKGLDILFDSIEEIVSAGGQFVLLGTGDKFWEEKYKKLEKIKKYKKNLSINILFDIELALKIYTGSNFLVVPSKYEPCGLIQLIALWYGTLPIVRNTGGLKDTVVEGKTGIKFNEYNSKELICAVKEAFSVYFGQSYDKMVTNAMQEDFSWERSAELYKELYQKVIELRIESLSRLDTSDVR